jgi:hypothetical protein
VETFSANRCSFIKSFFSSTTVRCFLFNCFTAIAISLQATFGIRDFAAGAISLHRGGLGTLSLIVWPTAHAHFGTLIFLLFSPSTRITRASSPLISRTIALNGFVR